MPNNDLQNTTQKTKDRATRTTLKSGGELRCSGRVSSSCSAIVYFVHTRALLPVLFSPGLILKISLPRLIIKISFLYLDFKFDAIHSISKESQILLVHMHSRTSSTKLLEEPFHLKTNVLVFFMLCVDYILHQGFAP